MKLTNYNIIVIKLGSALIIDNENHNFRRKWLEDLAMEIYKLREAGKKVLIVCSGAIASASRRLGKNKAALTLTESQAYAAYGQALLVANLQRVFGKSGADLAQILITNEDCQNRRRYLNMRATINKLLELDIIPVINENDTISTNEIKFGDNDVLAAQVVALTDADLLILMSDIQGLYEADPKIKHNAKLIKEIKVVDQKILSLANNKTNAYGTGGIESKIKAAQIANNFGADVIITKGGGKNSIFTLESGKIYSIFKAQKNNLSSRKKWLANLKSQGKLIINNKAAIEIAKGGNSLLPVGVLQVEGDFARGDMVEIIGEDEVKIAQGLTNLDSAEIEKFKGKNSQKIRDMAKKPTRLNLVHCDNMLLAK